MIRDALGKGQSPLGKFLRIICPAIGIIPQGEYLGTLNWAMNVDDYGRLILTQTALPSQSILETYGTQVSVIEVVQVAIDKSYLENKEAVDVKKMMAQLKKLNFVAAIATDPTAMAAKILGLSKDHPFMEVMSEDIHEWTGSLTYLFARTSRPMDLAGMADSDEHNTTNIGDPSSFTSFHRRNGQPVETDKQCKLLS
jgi:hypothetical protein